MATVRQYIDCREMPGEVACTVMISADNADELEQVAAQHAVSRHGSTDSPGLRETLRSMFRRERPRTEAA